MKRKKGFTLVELLAVIVLISLLLIITITSIQNVSRNSKSKLCRTKLSLIEDAVNLYLTNNPECFFNSAESNNCYRQICSKQSKDNNNNDTCITSVNNLVELGIVEKDKDDIVINPLNKKDMGDYNVLISYNNKLNVFETNFLDEKDTIDENYIKRCGEIKSGIIEDESEKNLKFDLKSDFLNVNLYIDGDPDSPYSIGPKKDVYKSKIGAACQQYLSEKFSSIQREDADNYQFKSYTEKDNILNCYFTEKNNPSVHILYDNKAITITSILVYEKDGTIKKINDIKDDAIYEKNKSIEIEYRLEADYRLDNISCSPNICDIENNKIKVNLRSDRVIVKIETDNKFLLQYLLETNEEIDDNYESFSKLTNTINQVPDNDRISINIPNDEPVFNKDEAESKCEEYLHKNSEIVSSYTIEKVYNKKIYTCKYKRRKYKFSLSNDNHIVKSYINSKELRKEYKWGQAINVSFDFEDGYHYGNIDYNKTTIEKKWFNIDDNILISRELNASGKNIINFIMPARDMELDIISGKGYNMDLYNNYQNADNEDGYNSYLGRTDIFVVIPINDEMDYEKFCENPQNIGPEMDYNIHKLNSNYNNFVKDISEINCYYDRKTFNVTINKQSDEINSKVLIVPKYEEITKEKTKEYRYGQKIMLKIVSDTTDFKVKFKINGIDCENYKDCNISTDGTATIKVKENLKITPEITETFKVYNYYQNADNQDGYNAEDKGEITFNSSETSGMNIEAICKKESVIDTKNDIYNYNISLSYIVKDNHEINCYYDRKTFKVTINKQSDEINSKVLIAPKYEEITKDTTKEYRYGQKIMLKIVSDTTDFNLGFKINDIDCENYKDCNISTDGTATIKVKENLKITPEITETFKVYNYYQNADNQDGYNAEDKGEITFNSSETSGMNIEAICKKESVIDTKNDIYNYNTSLSYIVKDNHEINCYYDRATVKLKYNIDSNNISSFGYAPANNNETNNNEVEYRYGQNIILKIYKYNTGYSFENFDVKCTENYATCICANDVIKININDKQNIPNNLEVNITKKESE